MTDGVRNETSFVTEILFNTLLVSPSGETPKEKKPQKEGVYYRQNYRDLRFKTEGWGPLRRFPRSDGERQTETTVLYTQSVPGLPFFVGIYGSSQVTLSEQKSQNLELQTNEIKERLRKFIGETKRGGSGCGLSI